MNYFDFVFSFVANPKLREKLGDSYANGLSEGSLLKRVKRSIGCLLFFKFKKDKKLHSSDSAQVQSKIIFFVNSVNQWLSLKPVYEQIEAHSVVAVLKTNKIVKDLLPDAITVIEIDVRIPIIYLWKLPMFIFKAIACSAVLYYKHFDAVIQNFGHLEIFSSVIRENRPLSVIFSNDHLPLHRTFLWVAKNANVPSVYIQHAAVSEIFPALSFNLSFLDGDDSRNKYSFDSDSEIHVLGSPKIDMYYQSRKFNKTLKCIGVCYSIFDNIDTVSSTIDYLTNTFPQMTICLRSHPSEKRMLKIKNGDNINISDSKSESMLDYLLKVDFIIGGNSSFYVEATAMNVCSVYFSKFCTDPKINDYYGFVRRGLIQEVSEYSDLKSFIESEYDKDVFTKAKFYSHSINEPYEGNVAMLISEKIFNIAFPSN